MLSILKSRKGRLHRLIEQANKFRDNKQFLQAANYYREAASIEQSRPDLYIQLGNMLKDSGQLVEAVRAYETGHNGFVALAAQRGLSWTKEQIADVYAQLGHAFKLAGLRDHAIGFYRRANALKPIPHIQEELKIAALTMHGVSEVVVDIAYPQLDELPGISYAEDNSISDFESTLLADDYQCLCWNKDHFIDAAQNNKEGTLLTCTYCGTMCSRDIIKMNMAGTTKFINTTPISGDEIEALINEWPIEKAMGRIGLVGAHITGLDPEEFPSIETIPAYNSRLHPGIERCSFDVIIIWSISYQFTDVRRIIDQAHQALRPNGLLILGYTPMSALPLIREALQCRHRARDVLLSSRIEPMGKVVIDKASTDRSPLFVVSDIALRAVLEPIRREGRLMPGRRIHSASHHFLAMRKSGTMAVGIMSGIGDAVWSFVIQKAVRRKYGADSLLYHVNDSGDGRRKRSNNMLARFSFVDDMVTSKFQIHADAAMDDRSGHLNYLPSGPVVIDGPDEFDYRLIVNTYLEHGLNYNEICEALELEASDLDFDFFREYREMPKDMVAVGKVLNHIGDDYVVFYYGAEVDNTVGGLNRDEIWRPEDWNELGRMIHKEFGLKVVVIGAPYDTSYANRILGANGDTFYYNAIGELDITETLTLIQRSRFVVAFPAGVGIVGPYMRVPTAIFWRPKHMSYHVMHERAGFCPDFANNWVPQEAIDSGIYYPAWYGVDTPETIMEFIRKNRWFERKPSLKIGKW